MENLKIKGFKDKYYTPSVDFNAETGICEIAGESFLESTVKFYNPLLNWLEEYANTGNPLTFNIKLEYYNTSSAKRILDILHILKEYKDKDGDVTVNWFLEDDDFEIIDEIEDYKIVAKIDINVIIENEE